MSIFAGAGALPSNFTVPFTVATVLGSIGVAGAAGALAVAAFSSEALEDWSFLLQAARNNSARRAKLKITIQFFLFMTWSTSLRVEKRFVEQRRTGITRETGDNLPVDRTGGRRIRHFVRSDCFSLLSFLRTRVLPIAFGVGFVLTALLLA